MNRALSEKYKELSKVAKKYSDLDYKMGEIDYGKEWDRLDKLCEEQVRKAKSIVSQIVNMSKTVEEKKIANDIKDTVRELGDGDGSVADVLEYECDDASKKLMLNACRNAKFKVGDVVRDKNDASVKYKILIDHGIMKDATGIHQTYLVKDVNRGGNIMIKEDALASNSCRNAVVTNSIGDCFSDAAYSCEKALRGNADANLKDALHDVEHVTSYSYADAKDKAGKAKCVTAIKAAISNPTKDNIAKAKKACDEERKRADGIMPTFNNLATKNDVVSNALAWCGKTVCNGRLRIGAKVELIDPPDNEEWIGKVAEISRKGVKVVLPRGVHSSDWIYCDESDLRVLNAEPMVATNESDLRSDCKKVLKPISDAMKRARGGLEELDYMAAHGEYDTYMGDARKYVQNWIKAIEQNPAYRW